MNGLELRRIGEETRNLGFYVHSAWIFDKWYEKLIIVGLVGWFVYSMIRILLGGAG